MGEAVLDTRVAGLGDIFVTCRRCVFALFVFKQAVAAWVHAVAFQPALIRCKYTKTY